MLREFEKRRNLVVKDTWRRDHIGVKDRFWVKDFGIKENLALKGGFKVYCTLLWYKLFCRTNWAAGKFFEPKKFSFKKSLEEPF